MKTVTFYSYKGGLGRSLLLANIAHTLARAGKKVTAIDLDFEAPGLHYKLGYNFRSNLPERGALDYVVQAQRGKPPVSLKSYVCQADQNPNITLMAAGQSLTPQYLALLGELDVNNLFETDSVGGLSIFGTLKDAVESEFGPDYLLLDARTGITHVGTVALQYLTDSAVCMFSCADESYDGALAVMQAISNGNAASSPRQATRIFPVISRIAANTSGIHNANVYREKLLEKLPTCKSSDVILLHSDPSFEVDDSAWSHSTRSLSDSVLLDDFISATRTVFSEDSEVLSFLAQLQTPTELSKATELDPPVPITERIKRRKGSKQAHLLTVANKGYVQGTAYYNWLREVVKGLLDPHLANEDTWSCVKLVANESIVWDKVPEQMRSGAMDFCFDPYYFKKSRQLALGYFPFATAKTYTLATLANGAVDKALQQQMVNSQQLPRLVDSRWQLREKLEALFDAQLIKPSDIIAIQDTTSATECLRAVSEIGQLAVDVHLVARAEELWVKPNGTSVIVVDHGNVKPMLEIGQASVPENCRYSHGGQHEHLKIDYYPGPVPVGLAYPKEDIEWGRAIAGVIAELITGKVITEQKWKEICVDLEQAHIQPVSFDGLKSIVTRAMSLTAGLDWRYALAIEETSEQLKKGEL